MYSDWVRVCNELTYYLLIELNSRLFLLTNFFTCFFFIYWQMHNEYIILMKFKYHENFMGLSRYRVSLRSFRLLLEKIFFDT